MSLLSAIGERPPGDPSGMALYASSVRAAADLIQGAGAAPAASIDAATFVGPAGDAARGRAAGLRTRSGDLAAELTVLAGDIARRASQLKEAQRNWDRAKTQAERALRDLEETP
jgi:hypothetical protein